MDGQGARASLPLAWRSGARACGSPDRAISDSDGVRATSPVKVVRPVGRSTLTAPPDAPGEQLTSGQGFGPPAPALATLYAWPDVRTKAKREAVDFHDVIAWGRLTSVASSDRSEEDGNAVVLTPDSAWPVGDSHPHKGNNARDGGPGAIPSLPRHWKRLQSSGHAISAKPSSAQGWA